MPNDCSRPLKDVPALVFTPKHLLKFVNIVIFDGMKKACLFTSLTTNEIACYIVDENLT